MIEDFTKQEVMTLAGRLSKHDIFFRELFDIGRIQFSEEIPTACVEFHNNEDKPFGIKVNPIFWKELTPVEQDFVMCHELCHIIFNHKKRFNEFIEKYQDINAWNRGIDVAVNEMLVGSFKFDRVRLNHPVLKEICFIDTVFDGKEPKGLSSDYYVEKLVNKNKKKQSGSGGEGEGSPDDSDGDGQGKGKLLDDHSSMNKPKKKKSEDGEDDGDSSEILNQTTEKGKQDFFKRLTKEQQKCLKAGTANIDDSWEEMVCKVPKKRKWENVIRHWVRKSIKEDLTPHERWDFPAARYADIVHSMGAMLPFERNVISEAKVKNKINILFYLDTSGSCYHLAERFFKAAHSIPTDRFNVSLAFFDTQVVPTSLNDPKIRRGGGTYFHILDEHIQKLDKYPDQIWVLTDGYGNAFKTEHPERWHWFLTEDGTSSYIDKRSKIHELKNYE